MTDSVGSPQALEDVLRGFDEGQKLLSKELARQVSLYGECQSVKILRDAARNYEVVRAMLSSWGENL